MFFGRSIRRKLYVILATFAVMIIILVYNGVSGLFAYYSAVRQFQKSVEDAPPKSELMTSIIDLQEPLRGPIKEDAENKLKQQKAFNARLVKTQEAFSSFHLKLDELAQDPLKRGWAESTRGSLDMIEFGLRQLEKDQASLLAEDSATRSLALANLRSTIMEMTVSADRIAENRNEISHTLDDAKKVYNFRLWAIGISSGVVAILFLWVERRIHYGVVTPLRDLWKGASRISQGDTRFRMEVRSQDEMGELAKSVNRMADQFQEMVEAREHEVEERSKQLVRSERLAGIGFLAAGIAHEINNPVSAITMAAESSEGRLLELEVEAETEEELGVVRKYLGMIRREAQRCQQITRKLLDFAHGQDSVRTRTDLVALINEVLEMISHMSKYRDRNIKFERTTPCFAVVNGPEIKQVIINLVANALQAMDPGGQLQIVVEEGVEQLTLSFVDDGCGMSGDTINQLFEPFFTKRRGGRGTGLGMAICNRIISEHSGTLQAKSEGENQGSEFTIRLPKKGEQTGTQAA